MGDTHWKRFERTVAERFGTRRIRPDGVTKSSLDVETSTHAVQVKHWSKVPKQVEGALRQAEEGAGPGQLPLAVIGGRGRNWQDAIVVMRLSDFVDWYDPCDHSDEEPELPEVASIVIQSGY